MRGQHSEPIDNPYVDIVVLTGGGRSFSAGGDADWMNELPDKDGE